MAIPRILIVEDSGVTAKHLAMSLRQLGYDPCGVASSGEEAVELARSRRPDLILMDIMLTGDLDGIDAAGIIQATAKVPIVFLSAYSDQQVVNKAKTMEPFGYLLKPFRPEELRTTIEVVLVKHRVQSEAQDSLESQVSERTAELLQANEQLRTEASVRRQTEERLRRTNRALKALSECNKALMYADTESGLIAEVCRIVVDEGGYRFVWVGFAEQDEEKTVRPVGQCGYEEGYLQSVNISWADTSSGRGPTGTAIRTGRPSHARRIRTEPDFEPWRERATKRGYASSVALPLMKPDGSCFGALNVYAEAPDAFDDDETHLLQEIANSLSHGIMALRSEGDRQRAERDRRKSEQRYREIFEGSRDGIYITQMDGKLIDANHSFAEMFGYSREDMIGTDVRQVYYDLTDRERFQRTIERAGAVKDYELRLKKQDGARMDCLVTASVRKDKQGRILGYQGIVRDISEQRKAESNLRIMDSAIECSLSAIAITDLEGEVLHVNNSLVKMWGYTNKDEILGRSVLDFWEGERILDTIRQLREAGAAVGEDIGRRKDGSCFTAEFLASMIKDESGNPQFMLGSFVDITERKSLERQLLASQKMEAIGTLAGGIAHDFNNLLYVISGYTELSLGEVSGQDPTKEYLKQVLAASDRAKYLVNQILTFSCQKEQEKKPILIGPIVKEVCKFLRASMPTTIDIRLDLGNDLKPVMADATQIHQVLMNLCTNAGQAMSENGGELFVRLHDVEIDSGRASGHIKLKPRLYQRLEVRDTGQGIKPEVLHRIFDPYFSTKDKGRGTGLGLSVAHGIVETHGGIIEASSEYGIGSTFTVYLPVIQTALEDDAPNEVDIETGSESILFVDDEEAIVRLAKAMLGSLGYNVVASTDSREALELFRATPEKFDLVITDMTMPHLTGKELAVQMLSIRGDIPVILCTGFSEWTSEEQAKEVGIRALCMKPMLKAQMAQVIQEVLQSQSAQQEPTGKTNGSVLGSSPQDIPC